MKNKTKHNFLAKMIAYIMAFAMLLVLLPTKSYTVHAVELLDVKVTFAFEGEAPTDGNITFTLKEGDNELKTIIVSATADPKEVTFDEKIPANDISKYTVTATLDGYTAEPATLTEQSLVTAVGGFAGATITLKKNAVVQTHTVKLVKKWSFADGSDSWPTGQSIKVDLVAENNQSVKEVTMTSANVTVNDCSEPANAVTPVEEGEANGRVTIGGKEFKVEKTLNENENTWVIINKEVNPNSFTLSVDKEWNDAPGNTHDPIQVIIYQDGRYFEGMTLNEGNNWHNEMDVPRNEPTANGVYTYTVEEKNVPLGYVAQVNGSQEQGFVIVNTKVTTPPIDIDYDDTRVRVTKVWKNDSVEDRPENIRVEIYQDGRYFESMQLSERYGWYNSMTVPKYDITGTEYTYTVKEKDVPASYVSLVTGSLEDGFTITNTKDLYESIEVAVFKVWKGDNEKDRVDSIVVDIYQDGNFFESMNLTKSSNWYSTMDLPKHSENGVDYVYAIKERNVPKGYTSSITGSLSRGFVITNSKGMKEMPKDKKVVPNTADC